MFLHGSNLPQVHIFVPPFTLSSIRQFGDRIMSDSDPPTQLTKSQAASFITGLFVQGIESGLVLSEFSRWFLRDRRERDFVSIIVVFVTVVGLVQSGLYFASAWTTYVEKFDIGCANWEDKAQVIPTLLISVPVQSLMIRRCYQLVDKNRFIITPLVLLLVASTVMSLCISVSWPYLLSVLLPSVLDVILTGIILYHITRKKKRVYSAHARKQISRFVNIVWQSALPPTICAICLSGIYIHFSTADEVKPQRWLTAIQPMIGKLYVLSLFYLINARPLQQVDERPTIAISTLTVPMGVGTTLTRGTRAGGDECHDECSEIAVAEDYGHEKTVGFAV